MLENVCGALAFNEGKDFSAICATMEKAGYHYGAVVMDAALFVPQSRPRLFVIAVREDLALPEESYTQKPSPQWHSRSLINAYKKLADNNKRKWLWWNIATPESRKSIFADLIEENPGSVEWHTPAQTRQLLEMMSDVNVAKVKHAKLAQTRLVGTIYKRTRKDSKGCKVQRAEVRFDDLAGCLRTPAGGSSRQLILLVEGENVRSRLISSRETARLMGLSDEYKLPASYNEAYHLTGDGVAVPVVRHIAKQLLEPILLAQTQGRCLVAA